MQVFSRQPKRASDGASDRYERHRPEQTTLYRLVQHQAATLFPQAEDAAGADLPQFVKDEFEAFLECGMLAAQPKLVTPVLQVVHRVITRHLRGHADPTLRLGRQFQHSPPLPVTGWRGMAQC